MAEVNLSFDHGQTWEVAQANFRHGIDEAVKHHGKHFNPVVWSDGRNAASLSGTGWKLDLKVDPTKVHVTGHVPFFLRFLEKPVMKFVENAFKNQPPAVPPPTGS